jgi:hypothetical protein
LSATAPAAWKTPRSGCSALWDRATILDHVDADGAPRLELPSCFLGARAAAAEQDQSPRPAQHQPAPDGHPEATEPAGDEIGRGAVDLDFGQMGPHRRGGRIHAQRDPGQAGRANGLLEGLAHLVGFQQLVGQRLVGAREHLLVDPL